MEWIIDKAKLLALASVLLALFFGVGGIVVSSKTMATIQTLGLQQSLDLWFGQGKFDECIKDAARDAGSDAGFAALVKSCRREYCPGTYVARADENEAIQLGNLDSSCPVIFESDESMIERLTGGKKST